MDHLRDDADEYAREDRILEIADLAGLPVGLLLVVKDPVAVDVRERTDTEPAEEVQRVHVVVAGRPVLIAVPCMPRAEVFDVVADQHRDRAHREREHQRGRDRPWSGLLVLGHRLSSPSGPIITKLRARR